jgi:hypothetical protein
MRVNIGYITSDTGTLCKQDGYDRDYFFILKGFSSNSGFFFLSFASKSGSKPFASKSVLTFKSCSIFNPMAPGRSAPQRSAS